MARKRFPIDISVPVDETLAVWPGTPKIRLERFKDMRKGDKTNDTTGTFSLHVGTHVDAPAHYLKNAKTIDRLPIESFVGDVYVCDIGQAAAISFEQVDRFVPRQAKRVLFKTSNVGLWKDRSHFNKDFVGLSPEAAQLLAKRKVKLVGVDYFSVEPFYSDGRVHKILLKTEMVLLEGINLHAVNKGWYTLVCLPMSFKGCEAAPARALLFPRGLMPMKGCL